MTNIISTTVLPAYAGMILVKYGKFIHFYRAPRIRGDDPDETGEAQSR